MRGGGALRLPGHDGIPLGIQLREPALAVGGIPEDGFPAAAHERLVKDVGGLGIADLQPGAPVIQSQGGFGIVVGHLYDVFAYLIGSNPDSVQASAARPKWAR